MQYTIMFFSSEPDAADRYDLVFEASRLADELGFGAVWVPERHFAAFGGLFPNPAVMGAALAAVTERVEIRAGSVITPLHDVIRVAEEWSMVDNISGGRVGLSVGSGWNATDFVLAPDNYADRRGVMWRQLTELRELWQGKSIVRANGVGREVEISIRPQPVRPELRAWATSAGSTSTFRLAGEHDAHVLTHLIGQDLPALSNNIAAYQTARPGSPGCVSLMLHTYLGAPGEDVKQLVRTPMRNYLRSSVKLQSGDLVDRSTTDLRQVTDESLIEELLDLTFERYYAASSLLGDEQKLRATIAEVEAAGVTEIACLVDFGLPKDAVLAGMRRFADAFVTPSRG
ncbi:MupA/Atu3671 family FMN-dependent luciferase-like monooxygenase [Micromonospora coerulea]|uniref:MupA/Atu3671 family FMN-dependent luciferase-like monooxygenase n=1 Tax=Micromonospora coerulea TaxID=47856 RepID=UPI001908507C|nr:MupA/Atu3671 family FMN-dependent luciferase-like monooxygenase [Micromonospora veneta]